MFWKRISVIEKFLLLLVLLIVITGVVLFYTNVPDFFWYTAEDQLVEWLTVLGLFAGSLVCFWRFFILFKKRSWWFLTVTFLLGAMLFFAAGEEISWGQRVLGLQSSEYFKEHNAQGETNLHNMVVDGVKMNKLIFTMVLGACLAIYLGLFPILHAKNSAIKKFLDGSGVPVARVYQVAAFVLMAALTTVITDAKNAELLECGAALLLCLIITYPGNSYIFSKDQQSSLG